jgi:cytochrome c oxidase assembly protein subunit 15
MKNFKAMAIASTLATYFLIFLGGLVRVSGAGLGCPDWPKCFGGWIPPLSVGQLPIDIDPTLFNFTLAWIEYINRLAGVTVGILIAIVAIWAIIKFNKQPKILIPSILAGLSVAFQGWQGGQIVATQLKPIIVSVHLVIAYFIVSLLIYVAQRVHYLQNPEAEDHASYSPGMQGWIGALWLVTILQVILGTQLREAIEQTIKTFPLFTDHQIIAAIGSIKYLHPIFGIVTAVLAFFCGYKLLYSGNKPSPLVWQSTWAFIGLTVIQLVLGAVMIFVGVPEVAQVLHLWIASLIIGMILISFTAVGYKKEARS